MMNKRIAIPAIGVLTVLVLMVLFNFGTTSRTAAAEDFASKFAADTKFTAEEMQGNYDIDTRHSYIGFKIRHFGITDVPGSFRDFSGTINYDPKGISKSSVNFTAKVTSIDTGVAPRDNHLRSADFFEVEKYPEMTFKTTKVEKKGKDFVVHGDLTLKGVTKQVAIPFTINGIIKDAQGNMKMGISAETMINRQDYGVKWQNKLPDGTLALSDNVKIDLELETAMKKKQ
ncbi:hypothetical protein BH20ACI1_BH20ACI1_19790 [soil metagenome]